MHFRIPIFNYCLNRTWCVVVINRKNHNHCRDLMAGTKLHLRNKGWRLMKVLLNLTLAYHRLRLEMLCLLINWWILGKSGASEVAAGRFFGFHLVLHLNLILSVIFNKWLLAFSRTGIRCFVLFMWWAGNCFITESLPEPYSAKLDMIGINF